MFTPPMTGGITNATLPAGSIASAGKMVRFI